MLCRSTLRIAKSIQTAIPARHFSSSLNFTAEAYQELKEERAYQYLEHLKDAKRRHNKVSSSKLWHLLNLCTESKHLPLAVSGVRFYQNMKSDFDENVASKFVNTLLAYKESVLASQVLGDMLSTYFYRIGAWITPNDLHQVIQRLVADNHIELAVSTVSTVSRKGVRANEETLEVLFSALKNESFERKVHERLHNAASRCVGESTFNSFAAKYPIPN